MDLELTRLRRAALGCVLEALSKRKATGVRVVNHPVRISGEHREWLTILRRDGSLVLWQHFPTSRLLGRIPASAVGERVGPLLVRRVNALFDAPKG